MGNIYPGRESKSIEFKSKLPSLDKIIKTCVAFANGSGGKIIIGVHDGSREIIGIDEDTRSRVYDEVPNSIYDATSPSLLVQVYEKHIQDVGVMIIEVPASIKKPVFIKSEGNVKGVYLRAGSSTRRATVDHIEELWRENKRSFFDEEIVSVGSEVLSQSLIKNVFPSVNARRLVSEKILAPVNSLSSSLHPTVAGILMFSERPDLYIPEAMIQCTRFRGIEGRDIIQTQEIYGCLGKQAEDALQLLVSWLRREPRRVGARLKWECLIPEIALREAIVNALIHRKYWITGSIKIALYDDRLEIFNPGNLPGLVDLEALGDGTTYLRNPNLARLARRWGLVEKLGTGIQLIFESCHKTRLQRPECLEGSDSLKWIFRLNPERASYPSDEEALMALLQMRGELRVSDVESYLHISRNTATRKLNQLIKIKKIKRLGKGPSVRYVF